MPVLMPDLSRAARFSVRPIRAGGKLRSQLGGPTLPVSRLGDRYAVDVELEQMDLGPAGVWFAARLKADTEGLTVRLALPQRQVTPAGTSGTGVNGSTLIEVAGDWIHLIQPGMPFSFERTGVSYLHIVTGVDGSELSIAPRLRATLDAALEFSAPLIEGQVEGGTWTVERLRFVGQTFSIEEAR